MPVPLLLTIALLSAVSPLSTDLYLAAFPTILAELHTTATGVQLTLTAFLVGVALGQLVFGPLSDRLGRVRPLLVGSVVCVAASALTAVAPTIGVLTAARFVQGLTGAAGMVIGRAIISDVAAGKAAARAFSLMMIVGGVAPVVAPLLGGFLVGWIGWRGIFWVVTGLVVAMLVASLMVIRETHRPEKATAGGRADLRVLASRGYLGHVVTMAAGFAALMAYISASPFVYQQMMGFGPVPYGVLFGLNAVGISTCSAVAARLTATHRVRAVLGAGLIGVSAGVAALLILVLSGAPARWYTVAIFVAVSSLGFVFGNSTALALAQARGVAGTASALMGALQFALGAVVAPLVGIAGESTALPLAVVMACAMAVSATGFAVAGRRSEMVITA
ncbi:multidrug effflux MFS transporter [Brooklawnia cerclae]